MGLTWLTKGPTLTIPRLWLEPVLLESNEEWLGVWVRPAAG